MRYNDTDSHATWNTLDWSSLAHVGDFNVPADLQGHAMYPGSNPVTLNNPPCGSITSEIAGPGSQPGDGTVPACLGEAPLVQSGGNVNQGIGLDGFDHQDACNGKGRSKCRVIADPCATDFSRYPSGRLSRMDPA